MPNRPAQAAVEIDATQLPRIAELLDLLDGFLRHTDGIADDLADYLHATGRDHPIPTWDRLQRQPAHDDIQSHHPRPLRQPLR